MYFPSKSTRARRYMLRHRYTVVKRFRRSFNRIRLYIYIYYKFRGFVRVLYGRRSPKTVFDTIFINIMDVQRSGVSCKYYTYARAYKQRRLL